MKNLKQLRLARHLSQLQLAMALDLTQQSIHKYETGKAEPDIRTLIELARFFHVSVDYLIGNDADEDEISSRKKRITKAANRTVSLTPSEYHFMVLYRGLSDKTQSCINHILEEIL